MAKIWIDLDNSPHVPLFRPIIRELERRGHSVTVTARDCFQVRPLLDLFQVRATLIGRHYGRHKLLKVSGLLIRALQLLPTAVREEPDIALSHGSRSQSITARLLRIPCVVMADYEHAAWLPGFRPDWVIVPQVVVRARGTAGRKGVLSYRGIKEDAYVPDFSPDTAILPSLHIHEDSTLVTIRPPATEAHYHNAESEKLLEAVIEHLAGEANVQMVILPRNEKQADRIRQSWSELIASGRLILPAQAVDGLNLIWFSDLVLSGGGTMNREAAALDVQVGTIFGGKLGAVDEDLIRTGRLKLLRTVTDVRGLKAQKRERGVAALHHRRPALADMIHCIDEILREVAGRQPESLSIAKGATDRRLRAK